MALHYWFSKVVILERSTSYYYMALLFGCVCTKFEFLVETVYVDVLQNYTGVSM